jgi:adenylate cyclase
LAPGGGQTQTELVEYGPTSEGEAAENWRRSVFFHLLQTGESLFRVRFHAGERHRNVHCGSAKFSRQGIASVVECRRGRGTLSLVGQR